jgi:protein tyrosine phosphatase
VCAYAHLSRTYSHVQFNENSNYVNANLIKGTEGKSDVYIASQAPVPDGFAA